MIQLVTLHPAARFIRENGPPMPHELLQLAGQVTEQTRQLLTEFAFYGLLGTCLTAAVFLLIGSLLLVRYAPVQKKEWPDLRLIRPGATYLQPKRPVENQIARANRQALQLVSTRIRSGQLSN